jgi:Homeodomain-like domain
MSTSHIVELLRAYSNQTDVRRGLRRLVELPADRSADEDVRPPRQRQHRLRADEVQNLIDGHRAGNSVHVLAKAFTIDRRTVSAILERNGIQRRYNLLDPDAVAEAVRLYDVGWSLARVADRFGVTARTVQNAFVNAEIPTRPVGTNQWTNRA